MPLSLKELKILEKLQKEFNAQVEKEQASIVYSLIPLVAKIRHYDNKAKKIISSEEKRKITPEAIISWEVDFETQKSVTTLSQKISPYLHPARVLSSKYHQYSREKEAVNAWFENAKKCNSLDEIEKVDPTALYSSFHDSSRIQQTFAKIDSFIFQKTNPYSIKSRISRLWHNLFSRNSVTPTEAAIISPDTPREAIAERPDEATVFSIARGDQLLKSLSKEVDAHKKSSDTLVDSMAHTLEHRHAETDGSAFEKKLVEPKQQLPNFIQPTSNP